MARLTIEAERAAVAALCRRRGIEAAETTLLKAAHHTSLLILPAKIVARVQSAEPTGVAIQRATKELAVTRHLAEQGSPAIALAPENAGPHVSGGCVITLWRHVANTRTATEAEAPLAARTLAALHDAMRDYAGPLPPYTHALDRCAAVIADNSSCPALAARDRALLHHWLATLHRRIANSGGAWQPLHGDAHLGNLLLGADGSARWTDFEDACCGPRAYDIAALPPEAWPHFADADPALIQLCADLRSVCVAIWCWADAKRNAEMREAADYHLARVRAFPA